MESINSSQKKRKRELFSKSKCRDPLKKVEPAYWRKSSQSQQMSSNVPKVHSQATE